MNMDAEAKAATLRHLRGQLSYLEDQLTRLTTTIYLAWYAWQAGDPDAVRDGLGSAGPRKQPGFCESKEMENFLRDPTLATLKAEWCRDLVYQHNALSKAVSRRDKAQRVLDLALADLGPEDPAPVQKPKRRARKQATRV